jgi:hypothetical protein
LLKRLHDKRSDYDAKKLKVEWKKQKEVIRNIAFYPFIIKTSLKGHKKRVSYKMEPPESTRDNALSGDI